MQSDVLVVSQEGKREQKWKSNPYSYVRAKEPPTLISVSTAKADYISWYSKNKRDNLKVHLFDVLHL